jgi:hypothetical protein
MSISGKQAFSSTRNNQPNHLATMKTILHLVILALAVLYAVT